jgi:hypothetical protein
VTSSSDLNEIDRPYKMGSNSRSPVWCG